MNQRDLQSLLDIYQSAELIMQYVCNVSADDFADNALLQDAVVRRLTIIGEAAGRISEKGKEALQNVEWSRIRGLRNRLVHEYDAVAIEIVWDIVQTEIEPLLKELAPVIPSENQLPTLWDNVADTET